MSNAWSVKPTQPKTIIVEGTPVLFNHNGEIEFGTIVRFDFQSCFYEISFRHEHLGKMMTFVRESHIIATEPV
jgi:hypothetical protein